MNRPRGYILPITLALLAIASLVLARVCRDGVRQSVRVHGRAEELQRKWGLLSCQSTYLGRTTGLLDSVEKRTARPTPIFDATVRLGGQTFALRFADESAKVNLNALADEPSMTNVEQFARSEARLARADVRIHLRPIRAKKASKDDGPSSDFGSFGQVFEEAGSASPLAIELATANLTCWGGGKLNVKRASERALMQMLRGDRQLVSQILASRAMPGNPSADAEPKAGAGGAEPVEKLLADTSDSQSLWVTSGSAARFAVRQLRENGQDNVTVFSWQP